MPDKTLGEHDYVEIKMPDGTILRTHAEVDAYLARQKDDQPDTQVPPEDLRPPRVVLKNRPR